MPPVLLILNAGSSSLKFAVFEFASGLTCILAGTVDRIGHRDSSLRIKDGKAGETPGHYAEARDHAAALEIVFEAIQTHASARSVAAVAHRIVHGFHPLDRLAVQRAALAKAGNRTTAMLRFTFVCGCLRLRPLGLAF